jgi:flagellar protein FlgJ
VINPAASTPAAAAPTDSREAQLRKAAEAFEAVFLRQVIGSMRQAKLGEDLFGSQATEQFRDMADARLADSMAGQGSFGIADLLMQQFKAVVRGADAPAATPGDRQ